MYDPAANVMTSLGGTIGVNVATNDVLVLNHANGQRSPQRRVIAGLQVLDVVNVAQHDRTGLLFAENPLMRSLCVSSFLPLQDLRRGCAAILQRCWLVA